MSDTIITEKNHLTKLQLGEHPIKDAPFVPLSNGESCIPQHFLQYKHDRVSVERIVLDIEYCSNYPIFVGESGQGIYIQIGIVGKDNYPIAEGGAAKLVYGRKWRVEPMLPTSEIIQTVFLALKIAKEHEIRELFRLKHEGTLTTPFNNHQDLPVLSRLQKVFKERAVNKLSEFDQIENALSCIEYDSSFFELKNVEQLKNGKWIIDIHIQTTKETSLSELIECDELLTIILPDLTVNLLYQYLMEQFILLSNTHVEEYFKYKNFNRFSKQHDIIMISELSVCLRHKAFIEDKEGFKNEYLASNYDTDKTRVPSIYQGELYDKIKKILDNYPELDGFLPESMASNQ